MDFLNSRLMFGMQPGLESTRQLCAALGNPQQKFRTIHVVGTNGKGSTSFYLSGILQAHGLKTGLYTSPHLVNLRERIRVNDLPIDESSLDRLLLTVKDAAERVGVEPTFFEVLTLVAFLYYAEQKIDVVVLEAGMGGRLDSTAVACGDIVVLTSIGLEHTEVLGPTESAILKEKMGVVEAGPCAAPMRTFVVGGLSQELLLEAKNYAVAHGCDCVVPGIRNDVVLPNLGRHYVENASLSLKAAEIFLDNYFVCDNGREGLFGGERCDFSGDCDGGRSGHCDSGDFASRGSRGLSGSGRCCEVDVGGRGSNSSDDFGSGSGDFASRGDGDRNNSDLCSGVDVGRRGSNSSDDFSSGSCDFGCDAAVRGACVYDDAVAVRLLKTRSWAGRMQTLSDANGCVQFILDGAHNSHAVHRLVESLDEYFPGQKFHCVFGALKDKDVDEMLQLMAPYVSHWHVTRTPYPRFRELDDMKSLFESLHLKVDSAEYLSREYLDAVCRDADGPVLVTGSLYMIGETVQALKDDFAELAFFCGLDPTTNEHR